MPSAGPTAYNEMLAALDAEMAAELGVIRSEYADKKTFRKAAAAAGLSWPMVQAEGTRRSGKPSAVEARNERLRLQAITEEEQGLPMHVAAPGEKLTYTQRALNRFREEVRASSELPEPAEPAAPKVKAPEVPKAKAEPKAKAPELPKAKPEPKVKAPEVPKAKAEPKPEPKAKAPEPKAKAPEPKPELSPKEAAMLASLEAQYQEIKLGGKVYLRHKTLDTIYAKGEKAWELGDEMPEWDEDLGEWKAE
jgi:outer membrane biosynthesis protein TonB